MTSFARDGQTILSTGTSSPVQVQMKVEGKDCDGHYFRHATTTVDISRLGARLASINASVRVDTVLHIEFANQKVPCRVVWVHRQVGQPEQIEIRCLDEKNVPWANLVSANVVGVATREPAGTSTQRNSGEHGWPARDRRGASRHSCKNAFASIRQVGDSRSSSARLSDISRTGCYLEMMCPLAVGTEIELLVQTEHPEFPLTGIVRTQHPAMGNGVEFTKLNPGSVQLLERLLASITTPPTLALASSAGPGTQDRDSRAADDRILALESQIAALLELLEKKSIVSREELLQHLEKN